MHLFGLLVNCVGVRVHFVGVRVHCVGECVHVQVCMCLHVCMSH